MIVSRSILNEISQSVLKESSNDEDLILMYILNYIGVGELSEIENKSMIKDLIHSVRISFSLLNNWERMKPNQLEDILMFKYKISQKESHNIVVLFCAAEFNNLVEMVSSSLD